MLTTYALAPLLLLAAVGAAQAQTTASELQPAATAAGGPAPVAAAAPARPVAEVEAYIRSATKGGDLDYDKMLASKKQTVFLHDGNMYSKREYALALWGSRVKALGLPTAERACSLYSAISGRSLSPAEKQALVNGFDGATAE